MKNRYTSIILWIVFVLISSCTSQLPLCADSDSNSNSPIPMATLEGEPSAFIHQSVNVITGQFVQWRTDLVSYHGVNPLTIERTSFNTSAQQGALGRCWTLNHQTGITDSSIPKKKDHKYRIAVEDYNICIHFSGSKKDLKTGLHVADYSLEKGISNTSHGVISGQNNLKNWILSFLNQTEFNLRLGTGGVKSFSLHNDYQLTYEMKPTGNFIFYTYNNDGDMPSTIELVNNAQKVTQSISLEKMTNRKIRKNKVREIHTSDGRWVRYKFSCNGLKECFLNIVERSDGPQEEYNYFYFDETYDWIDTLHRIKKPDGRVLEVDYYDIDTHIVAGHKILVDDIRDPRNLRVKELLAPVGVDQSLHPIYQFVYHLNERKTKHNPHKELLDGRCEVYNALRHKTEYSFNKDQRLTAIDKYQANGTHYTRESLTWGEIGTTDYTQLLKRTLEQIGLGTIFTHAYQYDNFGNVIRDSINGNFSGDKCESYVKIATYSTDGFNLLLNENDGVQTISYQYAPNSNKLTAKYQDAIPYSPACRKRYFYKYNDDAAVTLEIVDNGTGQSINDLTGVTTRFLTYYTQSQTYPVAFPLVIEEKYLDLTTQQEHLIHKIVNTYNNQARITKQDHYDCENSFTHTLSWKYDHMGNITEEIDAVGRIITRKYDLNGNCIYEQGPRTDCHKTFIYDFMNRLIREDDIHADHVCLTHTYRYDYAGNRIAMVDPYGQETNYQYDAFGREIEVIYPATVNSKGEIYRPCVKKEYDAMGNVTRETNAKGIDKHTQYNLRGKPIHSAYADGTSEDQQYALNGYLIGTKARNGTRIHYTNDALERVIKTDTYSTSGQLLTTTSATYDSFHLLSETDPMGNITKYTYYPNGQLQSCKKENQLIEYIYDTNGRLYKTIEHPNTSDIIVHVKKYDRLDRISDEIVEDGLGHVITHTSYTYDISGNICQLTSHNQTSPSITKTVYDSHGTPLLVTDAEGNQSMTVINYNYINDQGQHVPCHTMTDPLGNLNIIEMDTLGRIKKNIRKNAFGKTLQKQERFYDNTGNCSMLIDTVISPNGDERPITTSLEYDTTDRLIATYEAVGTPEQKQTKITYNNHGQKEKVIKSDGTVLFHVYDELGRLSQLHSSDRTIDYTYHYDLNNNPIHVEDHVHNISTKRKYDIYNRMYHETLAHGFSMDYIYDEIGRPLNITLPDGTGIAYTYRSLYLDTVSRLDRFKSIAYSHHYTNYDSIGHLQSATLIGNGGNIAFDYDRLGRLRSLSTQHWKEDQIRYDAVGNLISLQVNDDQDKCINTYRYDDLYQVVHEEGSITHQYSYDSHYNRLNKDGVKYSLNALHQLLDDGTNRYSYDLNGNLLKKASSESTITYTYDALDRLISLQEGSVKVSYLYDENNRRLSKEILMKTIDDTWQTSSKVHYLYQGQNEIGACDAAGNMNQFRLIGNGLGAEIGAAVAMEIDNQIYIPLHDHNGNVSCILDSTTGNIVEIYAYTAFGEELFDHALIPWRYASKRVDEESRYIYFGRRYYDPSVGRWLTPDPIGREGGPNLYAYVLNSPLTHFDAYGLMAESGGYGESLGTMLVNVGKLLLGCADLCVSALEIIGGCWKTECPIPLIRDTLASIAHLLRTGSFTSYKMEYSGPHSCTDRIEGKERDPKQAIGFICGIKNVIEDVQAAASKISGMFGGIQVHYTYNATHGYMTDIGEVLCQKLGIPTNSMRCCVEMVNKMFQGIDSDGRILLYSFSQGGQIVDGLRPYFSSEQLSRIDVVTLGSAKVISNEGFGSVRNYFSSADFVTYLADPLGMVKSMFSDNYHLEYLSSTSFFGSGHEFINDAYQNQLARDGFDYSTRGSLK